MHKPDRPVGLSIVMALVLALLIQGIAAWFTAAFGDVQISMTPLTH